MNAQAGPNWLNAIGIVYDVTGALLLGRAIFFNSTKQIAHQVMTFWNDNPNLRRALCDQRVDVWFGVPLLAAGFLIQLISVFTSAGIAIAILLLFLLGAILLAFSLTRRRLVEWLFEKSSPSLPDNTPKAQS